MRESLLSQHVHSSRSGGDATASAGVRSALNRVLAATIICTAMFGVRGSIFMIRTLSWNLERELGSENAWIYPLVVYTLPDVVGSISIVFCMNVEEDFRGRPSERARERNRAHDSRKGLLPSPGQGNFLGSANRSFDDGSSMLSCDSLLANDGMQSREEGLFEALSDEMSPEQSPIMG